MAGMFYSLQEAAGKLKMAEEKLKELVRQGRLREFRDGSNVLFKVDEVEALMSDTSITAAEQTPSGADQGPDEDEITLAETTSGTTAATELTDADTIVADQGANILEEADTSSTLAEDALAETKGATDEASLEEIEEDVNLDTFGSGSGLLDLSLQADDTSLGGILDEIYAPDGGEGEEAGEASSVVEVAAEAEQMLPEEQEEVGVARPSLEVPAIAQTYVELVPDRSSNIFGMMLFLPLLALVYMAVVAVAGQVGVIPAVLRKIQAVILPVLGGLMVVALVLTVVGFMPMRTGKAAGKAKAKKEKKPKKQKVKKAKS